MKVKLNQTIRLTHPSQLSPSLQTDVDGYLNYNYLLSNGGQLKGGNVQRPMFWHRDTHLCCPAIYFHSNPYKTDRAVKPWTDVLLPDEGLVYYNGDNKTPGLHASGGHNSGNGKVEKLWADYESHDPNVRARSTPVFIFEHAEINGSKKGYRKFRGYGIITKVDVRQEYDPSSNGVFSNYLFEISLFQVPPDGLDWRWIWDRRDPSLALNSINRYAPPAWKQYVFGGLSELYKVRQRIRHYEVTKPNQQFKEITDAHARILDELVAHYPESTDKGKFESLASLVAQEYFGEHYKRGWVTPASNDMGVDFVGRLDIKNHFAPSPAGTVLGGTRILVIGQAKCRTRYLYAEEAARDIARVAARLQRGYIGIYVTTGAFKVSTQREVAIDGYPIVLINGRQLADLLNQYKNRVGKDLKTILLECDKWYEENQRNMPPALILRDFD